jgi:F0F1-type ATP synthase assembly protein I
MDPDSGQNRPENGASPGRFVGLGVQFAAAILLGVFGGQWVDRRFGSDPWGVLLGAFAGFGAGFYGIYRAVTVGQKR